MVFVACLVIKIITGEIIKTITKRRMDSDDWVSARVTSEFINFLQVDAYKIVK